MSRSRKSTVFEKLQGSYSPIDEASLTKNETYSIYEGDKSRYERYIDLMEHPSNIRRREQGSKQALESQAQTGSSFGISMAPHIPVPSNESTHSVGTSSSQSACGSFTLAHSANEHGNKSQAQGSGRTASDGHSDGSGSISALPLLPEKLNGKTKPTRPMQRVGEAARKVGEKLEGVASELLGPVAFVPV